MVYTATWVIIYHLPPIKGTRNSHWSCRATWDNRIWKPGPKHYNVFFFKVEIHFDTSDGIKVWSSQILGSNLMTPLSRPKNFEVGAFSAPPTLWSPGVQVGLHTKNLCFSTESQPKKIRYTPRIYWFFSKGCNNKKLSNTQQLTNLAKKKNTNNW